MPTLTGGAAPQGNIMVVDDNPANLRLLESMLRQHGYQVRSFPRGRLALAAVQNQPPDLILLDINMPEMNGYEVCQELKSNGRVADIPVIFLSALNSLEDKVKAFKSGGVDYISKPFQEEEVEARVLTHVKLRRAQRAEHELLEKTLSGAVGTLWEIVQLSSPLLALRSEAVRDIVLFVARQIGVKDEWEYDLAARLCLLGCLALPEDVFERAYGGEDLSAADGAAYHAHAETAARLLSKIPRMELVAEIIRRQLRAAEDLPTSEQALEASAVLRLALALDQKLLRGVSVPAAVAQLKLSGHFDGPIIDSLDGYCPAKAAYTIQRLRIRDLRAGMVLEGDVATKDGDILIFKKGTTLSDLWIERLRNFAATRGAPEALAVRVPSITF